MGEYWHWLRPLKDEIEMHVSIYKENPERMVDIAVIDDDFGQYYDYQRILSGTPNHKFALLIREKVESYMTKLQEAGVLSGHVYGEYI